MHWPQKVHGDADRSLLKKLKMLESWPRPSTVMADACSQSRQMFVHL